MAWIKLRRSLLRPWSDQDPECLTLLISSKKEYILKDEHESSYRRTLKQAKYEMYDKP